MKQRIYDAVKKTGRYAFPVLLTATVFTSSCEKESVSFIDEGTKIVLNEKTELEFKKNLDKYNKNINAAKEEFIKGIEDGFLGYGEQRNIYDFFDEANNCLENIVTKGKRLGMEQYANMEMPVETKKLYKLFEKSYTGWDFGRTELEKALIKEGSDVKVPNYNGLNWSDLMPFVIPLVLGFGMGLFVGEKFGCHP